jgi:hypothetical protein
MKRPIEAASTATTTVAASHDKTRFMPACCNKAPA